MILFALCSGPDHVTFSELNFIPNMHSSMVSSSVELTKAFSIFRQWCAVLRS